MPAPIVVEVYAPEPSPQELTALIGACTRAAAPNECISSDARTSDPPLGVAIVRREGERARIELGLRSPVSAEWSTRDLVFQPGDDELERYRAIGFAIGTLVARRLEPPPPPPPPPVVQPQPPAQQARPSVEAAPRDRVPAGQLEVATRSTWLDLAGTLGLGLVPGPPRAGGLLRAGSELNRGGLFGAAELGYAERTGEPALRARWLSLGLGLGHPLGLQLGSLGVEARLLIVLERLALTAIDGEREDSASTWKPGVTAALDAHWDALPPLGLVVSAATHVYPQHTVVRTGGTEAGETPALGFSGFVGLRLRLR